MRIRKSSNNPTISSSSSSSASSSSSHSSITAHSLASSTDSSSSVPSISSSLTRCEGLNLLVKAIHQVTAGSVVGVPYIQRRVIRRRRRAIRFRNLIFAKQGEAVEVTEERERGIDETESILRSKRRLMALPSKFQDSVLQPWKPRTRRQRSTKIGDELGS